MHRLQTQSDTKNVTSQCCWILYRHFWNTPWLIKMKDRNKLLNNVFIFKRSVSSGQLDIYHEINLFFIYHICLCACLTRIFVPHWQHSEYEGTECGSEISSPVIPHCKICWRDLDTKQHTWETERARINIDEKRKLNNSRERSSESEQKGTREVKSNNNNQ